MTPVELARDLLSRIVWIREEIDPIVRDQALADLEHDIAGWLAAYDEQAAA
jgi:hypothetical protein